MGIWSWLKKVFIKGPGPVPEPSVTPHKPISHEPDELQGRELGRREKVREDWYRAIAAIKNESMSAPTYQYMLWDDLKKLPNFQRVSTKLNTINRRVRDKSFKMLNGLRSEESFQRLFTRWHSGGLLTELLKELDELARHYNAVNWKMHAVREELEKQDKMELFDGIVRFRDAYKRIVIFNNNWVKTQIKPLMNTTIKRFKL